MTANQVLYHPAHKIRIVTAASLFDGHDVAINLMRRIMQRSGAEVIHLGHNRSAFEIVETAIQEDVQAIAVTSYQGGHIEFFKYILDLLREKGSAHIKVFGGGGGTILPEEIEILQDYGVTKIYSPDDGRKLGLQGMINHMLKLCDFSIAPPPEEYWMGLDHCTDIKKIARIITDIENNVQDQQRHLSLLNEIPLRFQAPVIGITGTGGSGKSSLVDEIILRFNLYFPDLTIGIISVDPSKRKSGGALLGDRIRMNAIYTTSKVFMRSMATRQANISISKHIPNAIRVLKAAHFDLIFLETSGIGQSDTSITDYSDFSFYVMTPEFGAASQLEKIDMLDYADMIAINKFDKQGGQDAVRDVKKQYQRNHQLWEVPADKLPVFGTIASKFNDTGVNQLFHNLLLRLKDKFQLGWNIPDKPKPADQRCHIIPPNRIRYLSEIVDCINDYDKITEIESKKVRDLQSFERVLGILKDSENSEVVTSILRKSEKVKKEIDPSILDMIGSWEALKKSYREDMYVYRVRDKEINMPTYTKSISDNRIPKISFPDYYDWGDIICWLRQENVPGHFPYTAGVFPIKRKGEDPTRMFAGEGSPERTNKRFHYLSKDLPAKRLSTAFDSVTLYGQDPHHRPDIFGKVGNSGVSVCCLDDAKKLYSGFDLCDQKTSVSMTINGPASILCAFFMNAAIDQQCEMYIRDHGLENLVEEKLREIYDNRDLPRPGYNLDIPEGNNQLGMHLLGISGDQILPKDVYASIKERALSAVRGTVQADILKEDQAQNTCIFSTEFSLRLMGDMQAYFVDNHIRNFYSVSISGYHIAEAGANPITQLAFTLANGFTYVEYYLSRGMQIDDFAPNLSFFFSNGLDPEYAVIGRVARRIWAKAIKYRYGGNARSQKLKYHIQTSGRSLHAQEISFNDIRTTLQALYAIYDNCNSLHTNAYDEAITTPTEESVRRAMAIQLIINKELGLTKNENPLQGAFIINELTDLVENAVLKEFNRITERGGVLGAMETMYQRSKIQEESMVYETQKHSGALPIIGVNTFLSKEGSPFVLPKEVIRAEEKEKRGQIQTVEVIQKAYREKSNVLLQALKDQVLKNENIFELLMEASKYCTLGQLTQALFKVGGQYRRNM